MFRNFPKMQGTNKSGIYLILSLKNMKIYVGSAKNLRTRYNLHQSRLKRNVHHNKALQCSWNKYGPENFVFVILEECVTDDLCELENLYFEMFDPKDVFNHEKIACSSFGRIVTDETRMKMSKAKLFVPHSKEQIEKQRLLAPNKKIVIAIDELGNEKEYPSIREAARHVDAKASNIQRVLYGKRKHCAGYKWKFKNNE